MPKQTEQIEPQVYRIAMDWWVIIPLGFLLIALITMIPVLSTMGISRLAEVFASAVVAFTILYIVDTALFTYYALTVTGLVITSQLRHFEFPYRSMRERRPTGLLGLFSFRTRKRFAASIHAYQITLQNEHWKSIT